MKFSLQPEQLRAHEEKVCEMNQLLDDLMNQAPPLNSKRGPVYNYFYKERYLFQEVDSLQLQISFSAVNFLVLLHCFLSQPCCALFC